VISKASAAVSKDKFCTHTQKTLETDGKFPNFRAPQRIIVGDEFGFSLNLPPADTGKRVTEMQAELREKNDGHINSRRKPSR
jgi:hypothetical protein